MVRKIVFLCMVSKVFALEANPSLVSGLVTNDVKPVKAEASSVKVVKKKKHRTVTHVEQINVGNNAVVKAKEWKATAGGAQPILSKDGFVLFPYGMYQPVVICQVGMICDIRLDRNEHIVENGFNIADPNNWIVKDSLAGMGDEQYKHIIIKPLGSNLKTNVIIQTNLNHTYNIQLRSSNEKGMNNIGFYYPADLLKQQQFTDEQADETIPMATDPSKMNFEYKIVATEGDPLWTPVAVNDDGVHTYIHLKKSISEVPVFFVIDEHGKAEQVNMRLKSQGSIFMIDRIFTHGQLIAGTDTDGDKEVVDIYNGDSKLQPERKHWIDRWF